MARCQPPGAFEIRNADIPLPLHHSGDIVVPIRCEDILPTPVEEPAISSKSPDWLQQVASSRRHSKVHWRSARRQNYTLCNWNWTASPIAEACSEPTGIDLKFEARPCDRCNKKFKEDPEITLAPSSGSSAPPPCLDLKWGVRALLPTVLPTTCVTSGNLSALVLVRTDDVQPPGCETAWLAAVGRQAVESIGRLSGAAHDSSERHLLAPS